MKLTTGKILLAGVATAAATAAVIGHMFALDWVGDKLRQYTRTA